MCLVENAQHKKIFAYIQKRLCTNNAARQLFCSSLLFCFRELNHFLESSVRDSRKFLRVSRNAKLDPRKSTLDPRKSKLETRASKLDSRKLRGSRVKFRVETVNLPLRGTVYQDNIPGDSILIYLTMFLLLGNFCLPYITEFLFHHPYSFKVSCMVEGIPSEQKQLSKEEYTFVQL